MNTESALEQALHTYGDELYQTALLLTLDPQQAEALLLRATRALAANPPAAPSILTLTAALLAAIPAKSRPPAKLHWAPGGTDGAIIARIATFAPDQRLALDLLLRRDYEPQQIAFLFGHDASRAENELRTALLALAPIVEPDLPAGLLAGDDAPEECRPIRRALATTLGAVFDRTVRAHLATCAACRSAEQAWSRVRTAIEHALRAALRDVELPAAVGERMRLALAPRRATPFAGRKLTPRMVQIGLPTIVLIVVALLVLPRQGRQATNTGSINGGVGTSEPRALVQRASDTLYAPETGQATWHSQYQIRWNFSERMYVNLVGDIWTTSGPDRFRAQLVHSEGGAPYEFLLHGGGQNIWYASTPLYGRSIYGLLADQYPQQVRMQVPDAQRAEIERARLDSGAWGLAGQYLRQALAAERLSTWGRQRGTDGREQMVIGFNGWSPLGLAPDLPNAPQNPTTILLTVDTATGRLREIREVTGPAGGEQVGRTIWRQVSEQPIEPEATATLFTTELAYNGTGQFQPGGEPAGVADPYLPMIPARSLRPPTDVIAQSDGGTQLPATAPPGIDRAIVVAPNPWEPAVVVYLGPDRMMAFSEARSTNIIPTAFNDFADQQQIENAEGARGRIMLAPGTGGRFGLQVERQFSDFAGSKNNVYRADAFGFTRTEMLQVAEALVPFDVDSYVANARLFRLQQPHDPQALAVLLEAAQSRPLANGEARKIVEQTFQRQGPLVDPLPDPYHMPYYANGSDTITVEQWVRRVDNRLEYATQQRNAAGEIINQTLESAAHSYFYNRMSNFANEYVSPTPPKREPIIEPTWTAINLIGCGGTTLETTADGTRIVTQIDQDWYTTSCNRPLYSSLLYTQLDTVEQAQRGAPPEGFYSGASLPDGGPYLADVADQPIYNRVFVNREGQAFRYEVRAGAPDGVLVESVEIQQDQRMPAAEAPADVFSSKPPEALFHQNLTEQGANTNVGFSTTQEISYTQIITEMQTPLWYLPPTDSAELRRVFVANKPIQTSYYGGDIFDTALRNGIAAQLVYAPPPSDENRMSHEMFIGPAGRFRALLQTQRDWRSSQPTKVEVGGQAIEAWEITTREDKIWTLFERDGSLIAIDSSTEPRRERIADLQRFEP